MDYAQLEQYQQSILDRALAEGIRRNSEQTQTWSEYKTRHEKVIEGLEIFPQDLTVDCMVPIGKKALMRGKLTHTNEILVSLGEGYFVKYSAAQAIALCNRRIKRANETLESLEKERNLYEMRQRIPDAFGSEDRKDLMEHWDNEKLDDWRVEHRQREKEYRKKLAELRNVEPKEIQTEDDLFAKLDALELQEELEAELHRLEAKRPDFYTQDLKEGEAYEESTEESSEGSDETEESDEGEDENENPPADSTVFSAEIRPTAASGQNIKKTNLQPCGTLVDSSVETNGETSVVESTKSDDQERRVVFGEPQVKYFNITDNTKTISEDPMPPTRAEDWMTNSADEKDNDEKEESEEEEDDIIRIEFKHSDHEPEILEREDEVSVTSPRDIYRYLPKPKSILKASTNSPIRENVCLPPEDSSTDDEIENRSAAISAYSTIVKDIREHVIDEATVATMKRAEEKRPISKFKRDRASMKK